MVRIEWCRSYQFASIQKVDVRVPFMARCCMCIDALIKDSARGKAHSYTNSVHDYDSIRVAFPTANHRISTSDFRRDAGHHIRRASIHSELFHTAGEPGFHLPSLAVDGCST